MYHLPLLSATLLYLAVYPVVAKNGGSKPNHGRHVGFAKVLRARLWPIAPTCTARFADIKTLGLVLS